MSHLPDKIHNITYNVKYDVDVSFRQVCAAFNFPKLNVSLFFMSFLYQGIHG